MDLDRLTVELRPRTSWEAVDLGFQMVRAWWPLIYGPWLATCLPIAAAVLTLLGPWGLVVLWWLRPALDRVLLHVVSRSVFGEIGGRRELLGRLPRLLVSDLVGSLLALRLDPSRSYHQPARQLEGQRGAAGRKRLAVLDGGGDGAQASWLTFACFLFEHGVTLALFAGALMLVPGWFDLDLGLAFERLFAGVAPWWLVPLLLALPVVSFAFVEPFYVVAGFALYLNRRTHLEGWDVEIAFRRIARRHVESTARTPERRLGTVGALLLAVALATPLPARGTTGPTLVSAGSADRRAAAAAALNGGGVLNGAEVLDAPEGADIAAMQPTAEIQDAIGPQELSPDDPRAVARRVLSAELFGTTRTTSRWELRDDLELGDVDPDSPFSLGDLLAGTLKVLLLVALAVGLVTVVTLVLGKMGWIGASHSRQGAPAVPTTLSGLDIRPESLPDDVAAAAEALWQRGRHVEALGLLYRGALSFLVAHEAVPLRESHTEEDCLELVVRRIAKGRADYFRDLTRSWQRAAYAHRPPDEPDARALWTAWPAHFGGST